MDPTMRYSEMIAREKTHARKHGELPGGVKDLRQPRFVWLSALAALLAILLFI